MIQIVISIDPSTHFLFEIINKLKENSVEFEVTEICPNDESYADSLHKITNFPKKSIIVFLGHGQSDQLYGGECLGSFPKKPIIKSNQMNIFENQFLFILACDSSKLIQRSFQQSKTIKSIGFGGLPTSIEEVEKDKKLFAVGISEETIEEFKKEIVLIISTSLSWYHNDFNQLKDYMILYLDQRIYSAVLIKKDRNLSDLLFKMRSELVLY